ncbi:MAG TPA: hypothetical protein VIJ22_19110 [Polyangiaceae bacterium]
MKRRLRTKKILVATLGVGAVSYVMACGSMESTSGNLVPPNLDSSVGDSRQDVVSSGNLMAPEAGPESGGDTGPDVSSSGNLMAPEAGQDAADGAAAVDGAASDAGDDGG